LPVLVKEKLSVNISAALSNVYIIDRLFQWQPKNRSSYLGRLATARSGEWRNFIRYCQTPRTHCYAYGVRLNSV